MRKLAILLLLAPALASLAGCRSSPLPGAVGRYQGILTERAANRTTQTLLDGELRALSRLEADLSLESSDHQRKWRFGVSVTPRGAATFLDKLQNLRVPLLPTGDSCYVGKVSLPRRSGPPKPGEIRVCYDGRTAIIDLPHGRSFLLDRIDPNGNQPPSEAPADYPVTSLLNRSMSRNFSSQIEFEHVVQARLASRNAHLSLLPHFSSGTFMGLVSFNMMTLVRSIGDLVPFLLPTRWFRAREAGFKSAAEFDGWLLMKADSAHIAEGLSYAVARDTRSISTLEAHRAEIAAIREQVHGRELLGLLPPGSVDDMDAVLNTVDKALLLLRTTLQEEYSALARAAGFFNPRAVRSVVLDTQTTIDRPETIDPDAVSSLALARSIELRQIDALTEAAKLSRRARYFNWLDPAGDAGGDIGFGMGSYIAIGASQVREMLLRRQQMQALLLQKVADTLNGLRSSVEARALSRRSLELQASRISRLVDAMSLGKTISLTDLSMALQDKLRADLDLVNTEFEYLVGVSRLNRVLFTGPYQQVLRLQRPKAP